MEHLISVLIIIINVLEFKYGSMLSKPGLPRLHLRESFLYVTEVSCQHVATAVILDLLNLKTFCSVCVPSHQECVKSLEARGLGKWLL